MKNAITRRQFLKAAGATAALSGAAGLLTACGGGSSSAASGGAGAADTTYTILYSSQPSTLNYLTTGSDIEMTVGANCVDTLVEYDNKGVMKEGLATEWTWDADTLTWTFKLREENWVDMNGEVVAPVTAQDFVDAMKYVLDPANASSNSSLVTSYIAGADEYYEYQACLTNAKAGLVDEGTSYTVDAAGVVTVTEADGTATTYDPVAFETVGVKAVDEHTLQYTLTYDFPGFLSLLVYLPYEPAYGPLLEQAADQFATSAETTYSCGAYYLSSFEVESWSLTKNAENYDADKVYVEEIQRIYNAEAGTVGPEMIKRGEIDEATIGSDILDSWLADPATKELVSMDRPSTNYTYFYLFNFMPFAHSFPNWEVGGMEAEYEPENWAKAINNTNFRKSIMHAINKNVTLAVQAPEGYESYKLNTITPPSFCATTAGVDYTKCGKLANVGESFDEAKAKQFRDAAIPELKAAGVTLPIKIQVPYNPSSTDWDKECQVLKQQVEGVLNDGADYIEMIITTGPSDNFLSAVRRDGKYAFLKSNWGADYSDPETESDPFYQAEGARGSRYSYLRTGVEDGFITGETADAVMSYMTQIEAAKKITTDIDARYEAFANAEATLIENALIIPLSMSVPAYIATRLNYWEGQYASTGFSNKRMKGIHLLDHYVSMAEYEGNRDAR
ncbi:MAG: peptide ABC transporter substrate-binding protein [Faecalibacterium sp.]|nr:peptide ABC transporter substrate-binding protein [Faecalibacterium sp.]